MVNKSRLIAENSTSNKEAAVKRYKELTQLDESVKLTEANIDPWALSKACHEFCAPTYDVRQALISESMLNEDSVDQAARQLDAEVSEAESKSELEAELDRCLQLARRKAKRGSRGDYPNLLIEGSAGFAKAQPLTSKVYTPYGYKLMGDIKIGDIVLDGKGNPTKVLGVFPQGKRPIYKINLDDGTYIETADNHLNSVYRIWSKSGARDRKQKEGREDFVIETIKLKEMIETLPISSTCYGRYNHPRFYIDCASIEDWGNDEELPIDPYLLGCLIGDGTLCQETGLKFTTADEEIKSKLNNILIEEWESQFKLDSKKSAAENLNIVNCEKYNHFRSKTAGVSGLRYQLKELGLNVKSEFKFIPNKYIFTNFENRLKLLQGLMDTDGTVDNIYQKNGDKCSNISFTTVSKQLAEDITFLARSLGCKAKIGKEEGRTYHYVYKDINEIRSCKDAYHVYIGAPEDLKVFTLERKLNRIINKTPRNRRGILSIEFDREDECQCIYVESPEHTYITDNLTITHNTAVVQQWAAKNGVHLYARDAGKLSQEQIGGLVGYDSDDPTMVKELGNKSFYQGLSQPNTVLFLDEYNRARSNIRSLLLKLVNEHVLPGGPEGDIFLPNLLFTVAAINPTSTAYETNSLDAAERSRFKRVVVTPNPIEHLKYLKKEYAAELKDAQDDGDEDWIKEVQGRIKLADTLLNDPRFEYTSLQQEEKMIDDPNFTPTNYRSFKEALDHSNGTKDDFLKQWSTYCDYTQKKTIEDILKNFVDVDNKANAALKGGSKSKVFQKTLSNMEKIQNLLNDTNSN